VSVSYFFLKYAHLEDGTGIKGEENITVVGRRGGCGGRADDDLIFVHLHAACDSYW
jgi:hypothetical protein